MSPIDKSLISNLLLGVGGGSPCTGAIQASLPASPLGKNQFVLMCCQLHGSERARVMASRTALQGLRAIFGLGPLCKILMMGVRYGPKCFQTMCFKCISKPSHWCLCWVKSTSEESPFAKESSGSRLSLAVLVQAVHSSGGDPQGCTCAHSCWGSRSSSVQGTPGMLEEIERIRRESDHVTLPAPLRSRSREDPPVKSVHILGSDRSQGPVEGPTHQLPPRSRRWKRS